MKPRFTDADRYTRPYVRSDKSRHPGYLARRFADIRAEQKRIAEETAVKVQPIKRAAK